MKKPMNTEDHGLFMETAGIEPALNASRRFRLADGHLALVDKDVIGLERWTWRLEVSNKGRSYVVRHTQTKTGKHHRVYLHRMVLGVAAGDPRRVDHINGDTLDNRRANLRIATTAQNAQNQGSRGGSSKFRGVSWDRSRQKWMASAMLDGRRTTIGRFDSEDEAAAAAVAWRAQHMPFSEEAAA